MKPEARVVYILECLKKTPPPVLIFAEKKQDVDAIQEYLLLKGVQAVATHGGKGTSHAPPPLAALRDYGSPFSGTLLAATSTFSELTS